MQKVINVLAVLSFLGTASIFGTVAAVYMNREALAEMSRERIAKAATDAIAGALPGMLDAAMPAMPEVTGGVIPAAPGASPLPSTTGPAIPMP